VGQIESSSEQSENDESSVSFESPPNPYRQPEMEQFSGPKDEDYIPEKEVYEY
jgi:hypothetical protein